MIKHSHLRTYGSYQVWRGKLPEGEPYHNFIILGPNGYQRGFWSDLAALELAKFLHNRDESGVEEGPDEIFGDDWIDGGKDDWWER